MSEESRRANAAGLTDPTAIRVDQFLPHAPAKVWRALTEPGLVSRWLSPGDFRLEVGYRYTLQGMPMLGTGFSGTVQVEVLAFETGKLLCLGWQDADPAGARADWTITWTLQPEGAGTRLFLAHEGFAPGCPIQQRARGIMGAGWRSGVARRLVGVLEGM